MGKRELRQNLGDVTLPEFGFGIVEVGEDVEEFYDAHRLIGRVSLNADYIPEAADALDKSLAVLDAPLAKLA